MLNSSSKKIIGYFEGVGGAPKFLGQSFQMLILIYTINVFFKILGSSMHIVLPLMKEGTQTLVFLITFLFGYNILGINRIFFIMNKRKPKSIVAKVALPHSFHEEILESSLPSLAIVNKTK